MEYKIPKKGRPPTFCLQGYHFYSLILKNPFAEFNLQRDFLLHQLKAHAAVGLKIDFKQHVIGHDFRVIEKGCEFF